MDVAFIAENTMSANTWYTVEAIMDSREAKLDGDKTYMNAFVYDASGALVGTSGWQYVSNDAPYSTHYAWLSTQISAHGYDEGAVVAVDEFNVYKITDAPTYTIANGEPKTNKYIATTTWTNTFRAVGEWFTTATNADNALISATSANKAVRFETSVRFPELPTSMYNTHVLLKIASAIPYKSNNSEVFDGTVQITKDGLVVKSYNSSTSKYDTAVTLSNGNTTYAISANEWYTLVWDIDYSNYASPVATLTVKDASGSVLVSTPTTYAAAPLVTDAYNRAMILWASPTNTGKAVHLDNTNVYGAATVAGLNDEENRVTAIEDDYEVYDNDLYAVGATYSSLVGVGGSDAHKATKVGSLNDGIVVAQESIPAVTFVDGTVFENTNPVKLTFTYDNPMSVANINKTNIELYENGVKKVSGYTVTAGAQDANACATVVTVDVTELSYGSTYTLRLKSEVADYNTALSGGVAADSGLYKDINFSVVSLVPDFDYEASILDANDQTYEAATLTKDDVINGNVSITNNEDGQITCYAILAIYDGNKLADIKTSGLITVPAGETVVKDTAEYTATKDGLTAKLFVWNNFETMRPWIAPVILGE